MIIESTPNASIPGISGIPVQSGDIEATESRPDNESAEVARTKAPLSNGLGNNIDLTV